MALIYVSSTYEDLKECREKVRLVIRQMGHSDVSIEYFTMDDQRPIDDCLNSVSSCDLYIGIFAWKYGYIPDGYDKSITELEYLRARELNKKGLLFFLREDAPWPAKFIDKGENGLKIEALRNEILKNYLVYSFDNCEDLASQVSLAIREWELRSQISSNMASKEKNKIKKLVSRENESELIEWKEKSEKYINELKQSYNANGLVLFLGSGVSYSVGMPDWNVLISKLMADMIGEEIPAELNVSEEEKQIMATELQKIHGFSPLLEARYLRASFRDRFEKKISENLYKGINVLNISTSTLFDSIAKLCMPKRNGPGIKAVVNYNFDDLLEAHLQKLSVKYCSIYTDSYFVSPEELAIYHVHGFLPRDIEKYESISKSLVVFSEEGYHSLMLDPYFWSNIIQLNCFMENTCLMIGLSVTDPNLRRLLDVAAKNNVPKHYVLLKRLLLIEILKEREENQLREDVIEALISTHHRLQEESFQKLGLNIIWYERYDEIPTILDNIREAKLNKRR